MAWVGGSHVSDRAGCITKSCSLAMLHGEQQHCHRLCFDPLGRRGNEMLTPEDSTTNLTNLNLFPLELRIEVKSSFYPWKS